jgi:FKBP-type peptidyl-prolyl cis-trans isomerase (trigger factor)
MQKGMISKELEKRDVKEYRIGSQLYSVKDLKNELSEDMFKEKYNTLTSYRKRIVDDQLKTMLSGVGYKGSLIKREVHKAHNYSKKEIVDYLIKTGSNRKHAEALVKEHWDYIHRAYHDQNLNKKSINDIMRTLGLPISYKI